MTGTIKKKTDRGFGFIGIDGQEKDLFFHSSGLSGVSFDELQEGAVVSFDIETGDDGRQKAVNVTLGGDGAQSAPAAEEMPAEEAPAEEPVAEEEAPAEASEEAAEEAPVESATEEVPVEEPKA